jgi:3-deoxy-D-manno-octulosonic-acid transferase
MEQIGSKELLARGGAALIHDEEDTASMLSGLFSDENRRREMGAAGTGVVRGFQGTLARTVKCMRERGVL